MQSCHWGLRPPCILCRPVFRYICSNRQNQHWIIVLITAYYLWELSLVFHSCNIWSSEQMIHMAVEAVSNIGLIEEALVHFTVASKCCLICWSTSVLFRTLVCGFFLFVRKCSGLLLEGTLNSFRYTGTTSSLCLLLHLPFCAFLGPVFEGFLNKLCQITYHN